MDFFQRQEIARRNTKLLEVYFGLAVIGTVLLIYLGAIVFSNFENNRYDNSDGVSLLSFWDPQLFLVVSCSTVFVIFCCSLYKIAQLSGGGSKVAEMLGGRPIDAQTIDLNERKLLNVVEEMAIASGTPVPQLYLMPGEEGINAFAAGHNTNDMVICVTDGALKYLTRDELQGVIGHEFSHILNGDMKLNLRLMGIVFGILCLAVIGRILLNTRGRKNPLPLIGLILLAVGSLGVFFGKLIKSAVSRQREFLADASSVQFTRNPGGLANALKKVGSSGSRLDDPNAEDASHFFFANGLTESLFSWMSTHPPLEERIRELDPQWDGKFIPVRLVRNETAPHAAQPPPFTGVEGLSKIGNLITAQTLPSLPAAVIASAAILPQVGTPTPRHLDYAAALLAEIPKELITAAHETMSASALLYAMLLNPNTVVRETQFQKIQADMAIAQEAQRLWPLVQSLPSPARLPLLTISVTALRNLSARQYAEFTADIQAIIALNGQTDLFAYVLQKIVLRRLDPTFHPPANRAPQYDALKPLLPDCAVLLSALTYAGQENADEIQKAFTAGAKQLDDPEHVLQLDTTAYDLDRIDAALDRLNQGTSQIKKVVLAACAETVAADGVIAENEAELLRAIADTLDCPIPPFLTLDLP
jgi:Zn-dependent protease with chaperone function